MDTISPFVYRLPLLLAAVLVATGLTAAAFYGWMTFGSTMLLTLAENGLSGCL